MYIYRVFHKNTFLYFAKSWTVGLLHTASPIDTQTCWSKVLRPPNQRLWPNLILPGFPIAISIGGEMNFLKLVSIAPRTKNQLCAIWISQKGDFVKRSNVYIYVQVYMKICITNNSSVIDPLMNMVLLTGGSNGSDILSSTELLGINGTVDNCVPPSLPEPRKNHVTFVTKDTPPKLVTCGGSTSWKESDQSKILNVCLPLG